MRTIAAAAFLGALCATACVSAALEEADARGPPWPFGRYELVSFNGQSVPVELSDGRILRGGALFLSRTGFSMEFDFPTKTFLSSYDKRWGDVWAGEESVEEPRISLLFEASVHLEEGDHYRGFHEFPLEWADRKFASGILFGNEIRVGDEKKFMVFKRR